jgi:hypothetical protein
MSRVIDPCLSRQKRGGESQPERGSEELVGREPAEREEQAHDWPCRGDAKTHAICANHPFPVTRHLLPPNENVSLDQADQKHDREQSGCRGFICSANVHLEAHHQRRCSDD